MLAPKEIKELLNRFDLLTEAGGLVLELNQETALIANLDGEMETLRVPSPEVVIAEVYSEEEVSPLASLTSKLPATLPEVLGWLNEIEG